MGGPDREVLPNREEAHLPRKTLAWGSQDPLEAAFRCPPWGFGRQAVKLD